MAAHLLGLPQLLGERLADSYEVLLRGHGGEGEDCGGGNQTRVSKRSRPSSLGHSRERADSPLPEPSTSASFTLAAFQPPRDKQTNRGGGGEIKKSHKKLKPRNFRNTTSCSVSGTTIGCQADDGEEEGGHCFY